MHVVLSTIAPEAAETLASQLIEERVAACVNILPGITSVYHWQGEVHRDNESLLVIKTSTEALSRLMQRVAELHPYDVPEIVALDTSSVNPSYAAWIRALTSDENSR
jgi:periplasmic divalent cation tolerance protein